MEYQTLLAVAYLLALTDSNISHTDAKSNNTIPGFNELNRIVGEYVNRDDWFETQEWELPDVSKNRYDFIVVGSGSAGSVIANRLSEVPHWKVLLLEAGTPESALGHIPLLAPCLQNTRYDWADLTARQPNVSLGLKDQRMAWPRGKALGGSSVINYMLYARGNRWDHDNWAAQGNPGWSYEEVLPYYLKSERSRLRIKDDLYHNTEGLLSVEDSYRSPLVEVFIKAGNELKLPFIDYNAPTHPLGVSTIQATIKNGARNSAATAFLWPVRKRPNLHIVTSAFVTKILIDEHTQETYGVQYDTRWRTHTVVATREVILSAGVFNSPQLLMLSGIGPKARLEELGIRCLKDSPVGYNLLDHIIFPGLSFIIDPDIDNDASKVFLGISKYLWKGRGPLTSPADAEGIGYIKTKVSTTTEDKPDIELLFLRGTLASDYGIFSRKVMRIKDEVYDSIFRPIHNKNQWTIFPALLYPKSVGSMTLQSKNPYDRPILFGNYFTDTNNDDIKTLIAGIRAVQQISNTSAFQKLGSRMNQRPMAGCQSLMFDSDEYWECAIRSIGVTLYHQIGTAKMGHPDDPGAVVNNNLQVYGVTKLRVVDTSIIPLALGSHTNGPAIMIGEKAADIIKQFWGNQ